MAQTGEEKEADAETDKHAQYGTHTHTVATTPSWSCKSESAAKRKHYKKNCK